MARPSLNFYFLLLSFVLALGTACSDSSFSGDNAKAKTPRIGSSGDNGSGDSLDGVGAGNGSGGGGQGGEGSGNGNSSGNGSDGAGNNGGNGNGSDGSGNQGNDGISDGETLKKLPKFGMLVNDPHCAFCHTRVLGDVASTGDVLPLRNDTFGMIDGNWWVAGKFRAREGLQRGADGIKISGELKENYTGPEIPKAYPHLDYAALEAQMRGTLTAPNVSINKVQSGNTVLLGTAASPITINKDVLIKGDLIIAGNYKGVGTIYVTGNVYIPRDLIAAKAPFPYPAKQDEALAKATTVAKDASYDGLGLVTKRSIFIGDLEKQQAGVNKNSIYTHPESPVKVAEHGVLDVYKWYPGGKAAYDQLYTKALGCNGQPLNFIGSFNVVDAFLVAEQAVAGVSRKASYSIRGGVIADHFHIISGSRDCGASAPANPLHGRTSSESYLEYDYRFNTGLFPVMEHVGKAMYPSP